MSIFHFPLFFAEAMIVKDERLNARTLLVVLMVLLCLMACAPSIAAPHFARAENVTVAAEVEPTWLTTGSYAVYSGTVKELNVDANVTQEGFPINNHWTNRSERYVNLNGSFQYTFRWDCLERAGSSARLNVSYSFPSPVGARYVIVDIDLLTGMMKNGSRLIGRVPFWAPPLLKVGDYIMIGAAHTGELILSVTASGEAEYMSTIQGDQYFYSAGYGYEFALNTGILLMGDLMIRVDANVTQYPAWGDSQEPLFEVGVSNVFGGLFNLVATNLDLGSSAARQETLLVTYVLLYAGFWVLVAAVVFIFVRKARRRRRHATGYQEDLRSVWGTRRVRCPLSR